MPDDPTSPPFSPVLAVIPARLHSQRLPRKMLREIAGKPLLHWTYEAVRACPQFTQIVIAVDSEEIASLCEINRWPYRMTSPALPSGTDRLHAISQEFPAAIYVNVQGDEPLITPSHIEDLLRPFRQQGVDVSTLKIRCTPEEVHDPNAVKVVTAMDGRALYFSRHPIPFDRDGTGTFPYWKHLGLYAYRPTALAAFATLAPSPLEQAERLEQLRLLENGLSLHVSATTTATRGIDTEQDLEEVERILAGRSRPS